MIELSDISEHPDAAPELRFRATEEKLRRLERHDWSLWATAIAVMLALAIGLYSFALPNVLTPRGSGFRLDIALHGMFAIVALFGMFAVYKQLVFNRMRRRLARQMSLMTLLQTRAELLQKLAILDPLTGLYNRRFAMQHLTGEIARSQRRGYHLTVVMLDINSLKKINDTHSHAAGDLVLREFAAALKQAIRSSDIAVRMGGDEFLLILPECDSSLVPVVLARLAGLQVFFKGEEIPVSFAAGWTECGAADLVDDLLERADQRLYDDKRTGNSAQQASVAHEHFRHSARLEIMGRLASGVAHDFNNLLTVIKGNAELASEDPALGDKVRSRIGEIRSAAERAASLTGQLLAFSRRQAITPRLLDLNLVVRSMGMMLERVLGDTIEVVFQLAPGLEQIRADVGQLEQVVMNLAVNSADAMPTGGKLTVTSSNFEIDTAFAATHPGSRPGPYVVLAMRDTGCGMDDEIKRRIFEPFFTTKLPGQGTGLGLAAVYGIVKQNAGYIWVDSAPRQGTCVSIYLPSAAAEAKPTPELPALPPAAEAAAAMPTVLMVEGFDALRRFMSEYLSQAGCELLEATTGEQAIQIAAEHDGHIHLMIAEMILPGMSGVELAECIAARHPGMKTLYLCGYAEDMLVYREYLAGAQFLVGPFSPEDFGAKLQELLPVQLPAKLKAGAGI